MVDFGDLINPRHSVGQVLRSRHPVEVPQERVRRYWIGPIRAIERRQVKGTSMFRTHYTLEDAATGLLRDFKPSEVERIGVLDALAEAANDESSEAGSAESR